MCLFFAEWMHISQGSRFFNVYLYHCMIESSVDGKVSLKTGHAHSLSGTLKLSGACPACTLNRITKLRPVHKHFKIFQKIKWMPRSRTFLVNLFRFGSTLKTSYQKLHGKNIIFLCFWEGNFLVWSLINRELIKKTKNIFLQSV